MRHFYLYLCSAFKDIGDTDSTRSYIMRRGIKIGLTKCEPYCILFNLLFMDTRHKKYAFLFYDFLNYHNYPLIVMDNCRILYNFATCF